MANTSNLSGELEQTTDRSFYSDVSTTIDRSVYSDVSTNPIVSRAVYQFYFTIITYYVLPTICVIGLVGNVLSVLVLYRTAQQLKQSIYIYMWALTAVDAGFILASLVRTILIMLSRIDTSYTFIQACSFSTLLFFEESLASVSQLILLFMSVERLVAVSKPLLVKEILIARKPFMFIIVGSALIVIFTIPTCISLNVAESVNPDNETIYYSAIRPSWVKFINVYAPLASLVSLYIPFILILILNIAIPIQFCRTVKRNGEMTATKNAINNQRKVIATVSIICLMYTVLTIPHIAGKVLWVVDTRISPYGTESNLYYLLHLIIALLKTINMAADFIIYIMMSNVYRQRFLNMFCSRLAKTEDISLYTISDSRM